MHYLRAIFLLFGVLWGATAMSFETDFNRDTREAFKKSIDYPSLVARRPPEKVVLLDWQKTLETLRDAQGNEWSGKVDEPSLGLLGEGSLRVQMQSQKGAAIVDITSLAGGWQERLDYVMWQKSLTHRTEVNAKVLPGMDDLYLIPKLTPDTAFTDFLYGNFFIEVKAWDIDDIDSLAKALHQVMKDNSRVLNEEHKKCFKVTADNTTLMVGEVVSISLEGLVKNWDSEWIANQSRQLLNDDMEYLERRGNVFLLKALKKGKIKIPFAAMNKQTLYVEHQAVEVEVR